jgi:hypothetical protein
MANQKESSNIMHSKKHSFNVYDSQVILGTTMNVSEKQDNKNIHIRQ